MSVEVISREGNELTLQVKVDISGSMLEAEEKIQDACHALGSFSTARALEHFDTDGTPMIIGQKKIHGKNERE